MFPSVGIPYNFSMIISPVKKFLYINGFGGIRFLHVIGTSEKILLALKFPLNVNRLTSKLISIIHSMSA